MGISSSLFCSDCLPGVLLVFVPQARGTRGGVAALLFLLLLLFTRTRLRTLLLSEALLGAEPLELVLQNNNNTFKYI